MPLAEKMRKKVEAMYAKEDSLKGYLKAAADDASQIEGEIQEEWNLVNILNNKKIICFVHTARFLI